MEVPVRHGRQLWEIGTTKRKLGIRCIMANSREKHLKPVARSAYRIRCIRCTHTRLGETNEMNVNIGKVRKPRNESNLPVCTPGP
jgi:hypothetical protein